MGFKVPHVQNQVGGSVGAGQTNYFPVASGRLTPRANEAQNQMRWHTAVTLSHLWARVVANATSASSSVVSRKNGVDGNLTLSIGAGATGTFEDTTHTDSIASGDDAAIKVVAGAGGPLGIETISILVEPSSGTVVKLSNTSVTPNANGVTRVVRLTGWDDNTVTGSEAQTQLEFENAGTLKNLYVYVSSNARTTDTTISVRKNGSNTGCPTVTVGAGGTGVFEDTSTTVAVANGDDINYRWTTLAGTQDLVATQVAIEFVTADEFTQLVCAAGSAGSTINAGLTRYSIPIGTGALSYTTESPSQLLIRQAMTLSNLKARVRTNSLSASSTLKLRKNGADGNQVLTIGAGVTGWIEDTTNSDTLADGDLINYQLVTGATGTSIVVDMTGMKAEIISASAPAAPTGLTLTPGGATEVLVEWTDNSADETGFKLERAPNVALTGTVTTDGSADVVGSGTLATTELAVNQMIRIAGLAGQYKVTAITDNTHFAVTPSPSAIAGAAASKPGSFVSVTTTAADAEEHNATGLTQQTIYWFRVAATNAGGDSAFTDAEWALTKALPVVSITSPPDGSIVTPGVEITFSATATDPDGYEFTNEDLEWTSDLDGLVGTGLNPSFALSTGTHVITFSATDDDGDVVSDSITVVVGTPSAGATVIRSPIMKFDVLYGVAGTVDFWLRDANGNLVQPSLAAADVRIAIDGGAAGPVDAMPTPNNSNGFSWAYLAAEMTGKRIKVVIKDVTVPAAFQEETLYFLTIGNSLAFYTQEILEVEADGSVPVGRFTTAAKAELETEVTDAITAFGVPTFAQLDARTDAIQAVVDATMLLVDTEVAAIKAKTDALPSDPADQSLIIAATDAIMSRLGAPAGASHAADIAAIQTDTNDIQTRLPAALVSGRMDSSLAAAGLATDAVNEIRDAIFALTKDGLTFAQLMGVIGAALAGKLSGAGTNTVTIRNLSDTLDRIVATVDQDNNRLALVLDLTGL